MARLPERVEKLLLVFKQAIDGERAAQKAYLRAKELCDDDVLKQVLDEFYHDEERHERELIARYGELRTRFDTNGHETA